MSMWAAVALIATTFGVLAVPASAAERIEITARVRHTNTIAFPPKGRAGDAESSHWFVRDRYARAIGDMVIDCRWVVSDLRLCVGQLSLPMGAIAVIGASRTRFLGQLAVVGGTGRYVGADGTLLFKQVSAGRYVLSINYERE